MAQSLPSEPLGDPLTTWAWARPFGVSPRQAGRWVLQDQTNWRPQLPAEPNEPHGPEMEASAPPSRRQTAREHHRVDTALFHRVQAMLSSLQDVQRLLPRVPNDVQRRMVEPLTTLHAELSGLLTPLPTWLAALLMPCYPSTE